MTTYDKAALKRMMFIFMAFVMLAAYVPGLFPQPKSQALSLGDVLPNVIPLALEFLDPVTGVLATAFALLIRAMGLQYVEPGGPLNGNSALSSYRPTIDTVKRMLPVVASMWAAMSGPDKAVMWATAKMIALGADIVGFEIPFIQRMKALYQSLTPTTKVEQVQVGEVPDITAYTTSGMDLYQIMMAQPITGYRWYSNPNEIRSPDTGRILIVSSPFHLYRPDGTVVIYYAPAAGNGYVSDRIMLYTAGGRTVSISVIREMEYDEGKIVGVAMYSGLDSSLNMIATSADYTPANQRRERYLSPPYTGVWDIEVEDMLDGLDTDDDDAVPTINIPVPPGTLDRPITDVIDDVNATPRTAIGSTAIPDTGVDTGTDTDTGVDTGEKTEDDTVPFIPTFEKESDFDDYKMPDVTKKFPFSVPFALIACFTVLNARAEAPVFEIPFIIPMLNFEYTMTIDLSLYEEQMAMARWFFILLFIIGLIVLTRGIIRG